MNKTSISWVRNPHPIAGTGFTWNPFSGCSPQKPSAGCDHCYAERLAATRLAHLPAYDGLASMVHRGTESSGRLECEDVPKWSGKVRFFPEKLAEPLKRRAPSGIFVADMGDIALLPFEQIAAIFGVMAACPQHRFYLLTKRPGRLRQWFDDWLDSKCPDSDWSWSRWTRCWTELSRHFVTDPTAIQPKRWPLPNVFVGTSVCTSADLGNLDELRRIPAAVRYVSFEPLLEDLGQVDLTGIAWAIIGGESGPRARPCHVEWVRSLVRQCKAAGCATWVKQLGANPVESPLSQFEGAMGVDEIELRDRAGSDMAEWPADLRMRETPKGT